MCFAFLNICTKMLARSAESASGGLEVLEDVLDESSLRGGAVGAAHKVAAERVGVVPPNLEATASRDDRVLLGLH